jgi:hypothetical protein
LSAFLVLAIAVLGTSTMAYAYGVTPNPNPLPESAVTSTLVYMGGEPGNQIYRYDFKVRNIAVPPAIQTVLIFFDSDPVTGEFMGDKSDLVEIQSPANWEGTAFADPDPAPWFVEWITFSGPDRIFPGNDLEGFSITFTWKDPETTPGRRFFEAMNGVVYEGQTIIVGMIDESGSICGTVFDECLSTTVANITVDLLNSTGTFEGATTTDENGEYCFVELLADDYTVSIVTPLGFTVDAETKMVSLGPAEHATVDFHLYCQEIEPEQRTIGYWKHQANALVTGKGKPQETMAQMIEYIHGIRSHFNEHLYNPVIVFEVELDPDNATAADSLLALRQMLKVNHGSNMLERAKQQMIALLLNVASLKLSQAEVISEDGANVSQAITYCNKIITDQATGVDYEVAKTIADDINNGVTVAAGVIPLETEIIWYSIDSRDIVQVVDMRPNPMSSVVAVKYMVPDTHANKEASLEVFDVQGRMIYESGQLDLSPGEHEIRWMGQDALGNRVASGTYFMMIRSRDGISSRKVTVLRSQ